MEGYVLVDNGRLTEKEARLNMEQCADFLARMIQKYGPAILAELKEKDAKESGECIRCCRRLSGLSAVFPDNALK